MAEEYVLDNGQPASRAEYIRQEFMKDRHRRDIAEELDVTYNIVYSATANMFNAEHPEGSSGGGRAVSAEHPITGEVGKRADIMRDLYGEQGWTRNEIAAHFQCPYGSVYGATKDVEPPEGSKAAHGGKIFIEHPDTGEEIARVDFIREKFEEGMSRREIADLIAVDYSVVWMATREEKEEVPEDAEETADFEDEEDPDL